MFLEGLLRLRKSMERIFRHTETVNRRGKMLAEDCKSSVPDFQIKNISISHFFCRISDLNDSAISSKTINQSLRN